MSIAIIGMSCLFPGSRDLASYWKNIINKENCITDIPKTHWRPDEYFDHDIHAQDKTYCKKGGFIPHVEFDPLEFSIPPSQLETIDIAQLLSLVVARDAFLDAGLIGKGARPFNRQKTGVILGSAGSGYTVQHYCARMEMPALEKVLESTGLHEQEIQTIIERYKSSFIEWQESSFPGLLNNIIAGRICNRFDLGGTNLTVDAACASSLSALKMAIFELESGNCDIMLSGGVNEGNSAFAFVCFSKTPVLSFRNECRPFDHLADGTILGEGIGMVVLKRLEDALSDKDRIYAVIKGVGSSSDGYSSNIYAPRSEGQIAALKRAYENAGILPESVSLIEAHATGTVAGDLAEMASLNAFFGSTQVLRQSIALGSVKSQIGHTTSAAGAASLIKIALALYHKTLPPTINVEMPKDEFHINESSPFYVNTQTRPWFTKSGVPRRAGVNSFGFGGTNYHLILEEYEPPSSKLSRQKAVERLDASPRPFVFYADSREGLKQKISQALEEMQSDHGSGWHRAITPALTPALSQREREEMKIPMRAHRLGFIANSQQEVCRSLRECIQLLDKEEGLVWQMDGIYYRDSGIDSETRKTVALFSGQGSQYLNMASTTCRNYAAFRKAIEGLDEVAQEGLGRPISSLIYPVCAFCEQDRDVQKREITKTQFAQPAIGAISMGYFNLFKEAGLKPDYTAGHSYGELTALWAAGVLSDKDFGRLSVERGKAMQPPEAGADPGSMLAIYADQSSVSQYISSHKNLAIANLNAPRQVVVAGPSEDVAKLHEWLGKQRIQATILPVSAAFHTKMVLHAYQSFGQAIQQVAFHAPQLPVFSNVTGEAYPASPDSIQRILSEHIVSPVQFQKQIEALYAEGGYVFIEFGPKAILTNLIKQILDGKPHLAFAVNPRPDGDDEQQVMEALLQARVLGICDRVFQDYRPGYRNKAESQRQGMSIKLNGSMYLNDPTRHRISETVKLQPIIQRTASQGIDIPKVEMDIPKVDVEMNEKSMIKQPSALTIAGIGMASSPHPSPLPEGEGVESGSPDSLAGSGSPDSIELLTALHAVTRVHEQYLNNYHDYIQILKAGLTQPKDLAAGRDMNDRQRDILSSVQEIQLQNSKIQAQFLDQHLALATLLMNGQAVSPAAQPKVPSVFPFTSPSPATGAPCATGDPCPPSHAMGEGVEMARGSKRSIGMASSQRPAAMALSPHPSPLPEGEGVEMASPAASLPLPMRGGELNDYPPVANQKPEANEEILAQLVDMVSEKTGYPVAILDPDMDMEADLGIDLIKRVEIMAAIREKFPDAQETSREELAELRTIADILAFISSGADAQGNPGSPGSIQVSSGHGPAGAMLPIKRVTTEEILTQLIAIISEKTGYPVAILKPDMDIEIDLGIDSIKRVEIMSAIREKFPDGDAPSLEELAELKTISDITGFVSRKISGSLSVPLPLTPALSQRERELKWQALPDLLEEAQKPPILEPKISERSILEPKISERSIGMASSPHPIPLPEGEGVEMARGEERDNIEERDDKVEIREVGQKCDRPLDRFRIEAQCLPLPDMLLLHYNKNEVCLITHDGSSLTIKLAYGLKKMGCSPVILTFPTHPALFKDRAKAKVPVIELKETSEQHLKEALDQVITQYGQIRTFIHLHPHRAVDSIQDSLNLQELDLVKSVFFSAKILQPSLLEGSASQKRTAFMCVTRLDGRLGIGGKERFSAVGGGLFGLVKALKRELPETFCRGLDIAPEIKDTRALSLILAELQDPDQNLTEVGYSGGKERLTLQATLEPIQEPIHPSPDAQDSTEQQRVFLVTGGGRGITSRCILELARHYPGTYILLGRTSLQEPEPEWAKDCFDEKELKNRIYEHLKEGQETITPIEVERMYQRIPAQRQIRQTMHKLEEEGCQAVYVQVDICHEAELSERLNELIQKFGPITGLIHGAGHLADKKIERKTEADFDSVIGPKLLGLRNILMNIDLEKIKQVILFSSVAGFWGNAGQTDYALANEVLNKLAHVWHTCQPELDVQSINWGPWEGGMVTPDLKKAYEERNIHIISLQEGAKAFVQEMKYGRSPQIIVGSEIHYRPQSQPFNFAANTLQRVVRISDNPFLIDHVIGGRPVLPAMCGLSWMVSSCERLFPGFRFTRAEIFRVLKGVVFENDDPATFFLEISPKADTGHEADNAPEKDQISCEAVVYQRHDSKLERRLNYQARIILTTDSPQSVQVSHRIAMDAGGQTMDAGGQTDESILPKGDFYQNKTLFHGPLFRGVRRLTALNDGFIITDNHLPPIPLASQGQFTFSSFNPYTADVQLHGALILFHRLTGKFSLPDGFEQLIQFEQVPFDTPFKTRIQTVSRNKDHYLVDCEAYTQEGTLLMQIKSLSCTLSDGLTRLWQQNLYQPVGKESSLWKG
jgi:acyl transferase domain-containing protein/NAD(P)-dependent dehydrogenase (short-subunit alcohol dehydrogenase family)/acyl carrier protein